MTSWIYGKLLGPALGGGGRSNVFLANAWGSVADERDTLDVRPSVVV